MSDSVAPISHPAVEVITGMSDNGALEIFGPLQPGDYVVKRGADANEPGTKIKPTIAK
jgi:hypothetical protein